MDIDRATPADADAVVDLLGQQFAEHRIPCQPGPLGSAVAPMLEPGGPGFALLAREGGCRVGLAAVAFAWTLEHGGRSAWLDELYVIPDRRGAGIGTALLGAALAEARREGCLAVDLEVDGDHRRAEGLYRRHGFRRLDRTRWVRRLD